jgi:hypothetical protein
LRVAPAPAVYGRLGFKNRNDNRGRGHARSSLGIRAVRLWLARTPGFVRQLAAALEPEPGLLAGAAQDRKRRAALQVTRGVIAAFDSAAVPADKPAGLMHPR